MISFFFGFLLGVVASVGGLGYLLFWVCHRDRAATARALNGVAVALAHRARNLEVEAARRLIRKEVVNESETSV